jgi:U4/U6.U5 tri-snRNP-associated protein 1
LTLKDATIDELEAGGDMLENINLAEIDRKKKNLLESKGRAYDAYAEEEFGKKKSILSHYDELDEQIGFQLDNRGKVNVAEVEKKKQSVKDGLKKATITLDYEKTREIADYYTNEEIVSFRKPKKSKRKIRKQQEAEAVATTTIELPTNVTAFSNSNRDADINSVNFVDDDDLQAALSIARKVNIKKPAQIQLNRESSSDSDDGETGTGMIISDTTEFVQNLDSTPHYTNQTESAHAEADSEDGMDISEAVVVSDTEMGVEAEEGEEKDNIKEVLEAPLIDEPLVSSGLAATLSLLARQGVISAPKKSTRETEKGTFE